MNVSLYQAAAAMNANTRWQEVIANNMASASVPGFKRQDLTFEAVQTGVLQNLPANSPLSNKGVYLPEGRLVTSFAQGEFARTELDTDTALEGPGFFTVQLPNGDEAYTRDGGFQKNMQSQLVTKHGFLVMGETGPIQLNPASTAPLRITDDGKILQGTVPVGKLKLVDFQDPQTLKPIGAGCFTLAAPGSSSELPCNAKVRQYYLESSNTTPTAEMINLMAAMRSFEANQKVITMSQDRMSSAIRDLAGQS